MPRLQRFRAGTIFHATLAAVTEPYAEGQAHNACHRENAVMRRVSVMQSPGNVCHATGDATVPPAILRLIWECFQKACHSLHAARYVYFICHGHFTMLERIRMVFEYVACAESRV